MDNHKRVEYRLCYGERPLALLTLLETGTGFGLRCYAEGSRLAVQTDLDWDEDQPLRLRVDEIARNLAEALALVVVRNVSHPQSLL